jgi:urease accessory protein
MKDQSLTLLHIADSAYPTGSFAHSWGLEYAIHEGWVSNIDSLSDWCKDSLKYSFLPLEGRTSLKAWDFAKENNFAELFSLNDELVAFRASHNMRLTNAQMGRSFINITNTSYKDSRIEKLYDLVAQNGSLYCMQHPIAYGAILNFLSIPKDLLLKSLLFGVLKQWGQVAIRIIPLGQKEVHCFLACITDFLNELITEELKNYHDCDLQSICPGLDIAGMGHDSLKARYFIN